jgi:hypothetical protein
MGTDNMGTTIWGQTGRSFNFAAEKLGQSRLSPVFLSNSAKSAKFRMDHPRPAKGVRSGA